MMKQENCKWKEKLEANREKREQQRRVGKTQKDFAEQCECVCVANKDIERNPNSIGGDLQKVTTSSIPLTFFSLYFGIPYPNLAKLN